MVDDIFSIKNDVDFEILALKIFQYQYNHIPIYRRFCNYLGKTIINVKNSSEIPFLPIQFFKKEKIVSNTDDIQQIFTSSGTTGDQVSKHFITNLNIYKKSFEKGFKYFYGNVEDYVILSLLPSYLERSGSSLVYMADMLMKKSNQSESGFYLHNFDDLYKTLITLHKQKRKVILLGVSFALLDFINTSNIKLDDSVIIMETGGMKGKRKEMIREELHFFLKKGFNVSSIHSEYGMTELLSQCYAKEEGKFKCPPWMKIYIRDTEDPLSLLRINKTGGINIIDLANINSCSFIATQDLGKLHEDSTFEILGRFDHSDIRGCNLMVL